MTIVRWRPPAGLECLFALVFLVLAVIAASTLALAGLNAFSAARMLAIAVPISAAGAWRILRETGALASARQPAPLWSLLVLAACVTTLGVSATRSFAFLIGGGDASVYLNIAGGIEHRGGLVTAEPLLADLDADAQSVFFEPDVLPPPLLNFLPGGIQITPDGRHLQPGFFHLLPAAIAAASAIGGPAAASLVVPATGILTVVAVWLLAMRLSSPMAATTAAVLLTVNFAHLWFSKQPLSEMLTAALITSGLFFAVRSAQAGYEMSGALAGMALGMAAAARIDVLLLVSPLVLAYFAVVRARGQWTRATTWFAAAFVVFTTHALLHAALVTTPYAQRILWRIFGTDWWTSRTTLLVPALGTAAALVAALLSRRGQAAARLTVVRFALALLLLAAIVRTWPELWAGSAALLLTPVGLAAMVCGAIWLALDDPAPETLLVVVLFVVSAVVFVESRTAGRWYPLLWRRFVPIVLPLGFVLTGHALAVVWRQRAPWRWGAPVIAVGLAVTFVLRSYVILAAEPMTDVRGQLASIAGSLPPGTVLVTDASTPSHFGLSLHFIIGQPVLLIRSADQTAAALAGFADRMAASGRTLVLAVSPHRPPGSLTRENLAGLDVVSSGHAAVRWDEIERSLVGAPTRMRTVSAPIDFYTMRPARPRSLPVTVDIGSGDFPWRGDGFHGLEQSGDASVRWTNGAAVVAVPQIAPADRTRLALRIAAPRAAGMPAPDLTIRLDGRVIGIVRAVPPDFETVAADLDRAAIERLAAGSSMLRLESPTFVPREVGMGDDARQLGVFVDWLRIETSQDRLPSP